MLLDKKCQFFLYLDLVKIRLKKTRRNNCVKEKKKTSFNHKKKLFQSSPNRIFPRGLTHAFGPKIVYVDLVKIRLEIMVTDFLQEKRNLFGL